MTDTAPCDGPRWRVLLVVLLLLVPMPAAVGQSLLAYTCEQVRDSPAPTAGTTGIPPADECSGDERDDGEDLETSPDSDTVEGARSTATDPPGAQGYPLVSLTGDADESVQLLLTEPSVHSILVEDVPAFEELAVQFLPADSPDIGRASPCMEHPVVSNVEERIGEEEEEEEDLPVDHDEGVSVGTEVEGPREGDRAEGEVRLYPTDGFCAAVDATARATVDRPLFGVDRQVKTCTALACEHQTTDTAAPERSDDGNGTALFGPLVLYPGRWQVVRTDPVDVLQHADEDGDQALSCENALVVLCFDVRPCVDTSDAVASAPREERCLGPSSASEGIPLDGTGSSQGADDGCTEQRLAERDGVWYRWDRCGRPCSSHDGGELRPGERETDWGGETVFHAVETWNAWSWRDLPHGDECDRHRWQEADVAQLGLSVAGPTMLEDRYSDTWNLTLHASARECDRYAFPRGNGNHSPCHEAILKEPVIVVPDYRETRDTDRCQHPELHPSHDEKGKCVRVGLDATVVTPHERDQRSHLYHTGGDGGKMPASADDSRIESPSLACSLASFGIGLLSRGVMTKVVSIGCSTAGYASMLSSNDEERMGYREFQDEFSRESGYHCDGGCWSLHNRLESNDGWERDQMAFGAMMEMRACGEGSAPAYVAGTFLKGLAYKGPTGETHEEGGDPSNRTAGHHYWGPGLTIKSEIGVHVGEDAPSCPQERAS